MTVADLIYLLQQKSPTATVVLWDLTATGEPAVSILGAGEVQPLLLGARESVGPPVVEPWTYGVSTDGPFAGVVLGSLPMSTLR